MIKKIAFILFTLFSFANGAIVLNNADITSAYTTVGSLKTEQTITVSFDVLADKKFGDYEARLVLLDRSVGLNANNTSAILAQKIGIAPSSTEWTTVSFTWSVGDSVVDANGSSPGKSTVWDPNLIGLDLAVYFPEQGNKALFRNLMVDVVGPPVVPEPAVTLIGSLGILFLLRRRR